MEKIRWQEFEQIMAYDISENNSCVEIAFSVDNIAEYNNAWLGKMSGGNNNETTYWFGLVEDGTEAYDYNGFKEFSEARVFHGKNIREIWNSVSILSIDGCNVEERMGLYLNK